MNKQDFNKAWKEMLESPAWKCFQAYCQTQETILCKALPEYSVVTDKDRSDFLITQERMRVYRDLSTPKWVDDNIRHWVERQLKEE